MFRRGTLRRGAADDQLILGAGECDVEQPVLLFHLRRFILYNRILHRLAAQVLARAENWHARIGLLRRAQPEKGLARVRRAGGIRQDHDWCL